MTGDDVRAEETRLSREESRFVIGGIIAWCGFIAWLAWSGGSLG